MRTAAEQADPSVQAFERASHGAGLALALLRASNDCVKLIDLEGRVAALNLAGGTLLQLDDTSGFVGKLWVATWPEAERPLVNEALAGARAGATRNFRGFCPTAKGEPRWWHVTVAPIPDEAGQVRCLLAISRDISHEHERERVMQEALGRQRQALLSLSADYEANTKKLRDAEARVVHDDKLRLFGRFVGSIVHDFNNVFAAVNGAARLIKRRLSDPQMLDVVAHLETAVERGAGLSRQLLDFSRHEDEAAEVFEPAQMLTRDAHLLRHIVSVETRLEVEGEQGCWPVLGSAQKFQSVVFNLVANARDAIAADGRIEVSVRNCASLQRPKGLDAADYVVLSVADDGAGMPPEVLARAGEPFFTTKPAGKGSGLGLASAFELAAISSGRAFVESREGEGTRVCVYMRRSSVAGAPVGAPEEAIDPSLHGSASLLLVEDDALLLDHIASTFRGLGYDVAQAGSVEIAAATAGARADFDLVVTDLNLKDGRGDELVDRLREAQPDLPAIYLTGSSGVAPPRGETVLTKPVSEPQLARAVLEKLGRLPGAATPIKALRKIERAAARIQDAEMQRALAQWRERTETSRRLPSVFDRGPWREGPPPFGYVVSVGASEAPSFRFVRVGPGLSVRLGRELVGEPIAPGDEDLLGPVGRALRARLDGSPGYDYSRFALGDGRISTVERLLLPLADDAGRIGHIFGLLAFKDVAERGAAP